MIGFDIVWYFLYLAIDSWRMQTNNYFVWIFLRADKINNNDVNDKDIADIK